MKHSILFFCLFITASNVFSQAKESGHTESELMNNLDYYLKKYEKKELSINDISGSPYRYEKFSTGEVYFLLKDKPVNSKLNYNAYTDEIEFIINENTYTVSNCQDIHKVLLNNEVLLFHDFKDNNSIKKGFLIEIINNQISLYKRESIKYSPPKETHDTYKKNKPAEFKKSKSKYYISILDKPAFLVKNKKNLIQEFVSNSELKNYIKKEKINLNSEKDLIKLIYFLNQN